MPQIITLIDHGVIFHASEFFSVFNACIGMTLIVEKDSVEEISAIIKNVGEEAVYLGEVVPRKEADAQIEIC